MKIRNLVLSMSMMAAFGGGCVIDVSTRSAYEGCTAGDSCGGGTLCTGASYTSNGLAGNLCTTTCSIGAVCPDFGTNSAYLPTCVVNGATGLGQCYDTCASNFDCGTGTIGHVSSPRNYDCVANVGYAWNAGVAPQCACTPAAAPALPSTASLRASRPPSKNACA